MNEILEMEAPEPLPWEAAEKNYLDAFVKTVIGVLFSPVKSFRAMKQSGGFMQPLLFGCAGGFVGSVVTWLYQYAALQVGIEKGMQNLPPLMQGQVAGSPALGAWLIGGLIMLPVSIFMGAGIDHLMLLLLGSGKKGFETTFRVYSYAFGATSTAYLVPICGAIIEIVWHWVAKIVGYSEVHEISRVRATIAVLLPMLLCCICCLALFTVFGAFLSQENLQQLIPQHQPQVTL